MGNLQSFTVAVGRKNKFVTSVDVRIIMRMVVKIIVFIALFFFSFFNQRHKHFHVWCEKLCKFLFE